MDHHLVDEASLQTLLAEAGTKHGYILDPSRRLRLLDGALEAIGDKREGQAADGDGPFPEAPVARHDSTNARHCSVFVRVTCVICVEAEAA